MLATMTDEQKTFAFRILLRLVHFGEGRADTRRQQPREALRSEGEPAASFDAVLQRLVDQRLVTVTDDDQRGDVRVDLAHEILIHAWSTLADRIRTWRVHEQRRRELEAAAAAWRARGNGDGGLLDPIEFAGAVAWRTGPRNNSVIRPTWPGSSPPQRLRSPVRLERDDDARGWRSAASRCSPRDRTATAHRSRASAGSATVSGRRERGHRPRSRNRDAADHAEQPSDLTCGDSMRILAVLPAGEASRAILEHLGLSTQPSPHTRAPPGRRFDDT